MSRYIARLAAAGLLTMLAGCMVGPDYYKPKAALPAQWTQAAKQETPAVGSRAVSGDVDAQWWTSFSDAELSSLVRRVAGASLDVKVATQRLMQARAARRMTGADAMPALEGTASYQHSRSSQNGLVDISGLNGRHDYNVWQPGIDASWELDLWGRVRREIESADASVQATAELRRDVLLSAIAETASDYIQLRGVQAQQAVVEQNLDIARQSLKLTQIRFTDGVATHLETAQAAAQVSGIEARLPVLENQRVHLVNALSFLLGEPPRTLEGELDAVHAIPPVPPRVPVGLPSQLAERRPDIREAEARLHGATADIGVAVGDFYPRVTLSANLSLQAMHFGDLDEWSSRMFGVGPALTVPIFEGGRLKGQLELRKAQQREAVIEYQRTVLNAWHEVDNAMSDYDTRQTREEKLDETEVQDSEALENARSQYLAGATDFLNVLTVQRDLLDTQQARVVSITDVSLALIGLYKALGGGWETSFPSAPEAAKVGVSARGELTSRGENASGESARRTDLE
ncbi:NodT family efflux transporter outer membrane factor (OMF) lipoprotein [Paraburkholderia tropica]|uniref:NodT family efflux transporter outer membrane factor (OMF) lipoprotein n=1 Tax=Paraburkholderia tropica TaxID=92647 RepID=A0ABX5MI72_9BURK|nr:efflux transporter outer membrane subunit [Paraburkholderia tropica]PXX08584.1 NodT family efflux transporter outer membrane factor (OMF) lipoprotein [Paraburkholderia tropica]PZW73882.1 NodT family efflux transporter outer membrane factor (OMF) lipoprotein [Paraburkholderia tropica]